MVSTSEGVVYYCTVLLTALVFLTEASAITTNYEKSTAQNKTHDSSAHDVSPQRTKLTPTRGRHGGLSKNQNHDRVGPPLVLHKLKSHGAAKMESSVARDKPQGEVLMPSNSGGENEIKDKGGGGGSGSSTADDDDQKTLSQQVADGKYGLIQDEIFTAKPQRPGVLSYDVNPEVPKDNINNLGGLEPDDIWLAENHLLVLAGGALNSMQSQWTPIDNYVAPKRPVRLPPKPKVPPPFPVQLTENGPIEFLKSDHQAQPLGFLNPLLNQYQNFNKSGYGPSLYGRLPFGPPVGGQPPIKPLRPSLPINSNAAPPSPIFVKPPPGSEFIPPYLGAANQSEAFDEDDPSLYYPPPYDFYYPKDNTSKVPPGPLVPGIVLPPPPDFFTLLTNRTKSKDTSAPIAAKEKPFKSYTYKAGKQLQYDDVSPTDPSSTTGYPLEPTTFVTYDDIINDVTYPDTHDDDKITYSNIKVNKVSTEELGDGWIPIPAPKPFYITGPKKPIKPTLLVMMETPPGGYAYDRPATAFKSPHKMPSLKFLHYVDKPADDFPPTTPLTSQLVSTPSPTSVYDSSTTPSTPYQSPPPAAIKATYYFYEEPQFVDVNNSKPPSPSYSTSSPPLPAKPLGEYDAPKTAAPRPKPDKKRKPITPMIPIYYLAELQNIVDLVKPINLPHSHQQHLPQSTPKTQYYTTTAKPTYTINKPNYERPTSKPILEYSFVASDYNSPANPPPVTSTPSPPSYNPAPYPIDYNAYYQQQQQQQQPPPPQYPALSHYPVYNSVPQYSKPVHTTATPILFLSHQYGLPPDKAPQYDFERPWLQQHLGSPLDAYSVPISSYPNPTENPYYAFFTKEEEDLIDDNTKKYFTIFGQKIKHSVEATTPLPPAQTVGPTSGQRWSTPYTGYANYPSQSPPSSTGAAGAYDSYGSTTASTYQQPASTSKPLSLEGDTRVNYVTPLPTVDADAEYVPHKLSKHIRPIVVEDLPADVNERLKNIMNLQDRRKKPPTAAAAAGSGTRTNHKYRYTLIDDANFDGARLRYPSNLIDSYGSGNRFADTYSGQGTSTPHSLEGDIRVNYNQPQKLTTDADAEYVENSSEYRESSKEDEDERHRGQESRTSKPHSLANDILVNYKGRYPTDPDAEYIDSGGGGSGRRGNTNRGGGGSSSNVISYKYPGVEHGHFYFLTPQETHLSQIEDERYDFQSDVEKPSSYFKRVPRQRDDSTQATARAP